MGVSSSLTHPVSWAREKLILTYMTPPNITPPLEKWAAHHQCILTNPLVLITQTPFTFILTAHVTKYQKGYDFLIPLTQKPFTCLLPYSPCTHITNPTYIRGFTLVIKMFIIRFRLLVSSPPPPPVYWLFPKRFTLSINKSTIERNSLNFFPLDLWYWLVIQTFNLTATPPPKVIYVQEYTA